MIKQLLLCTALLLVLVRSAAQDSFTVRAQRYIEMYNSLAIAEQKRAGIPASVTLAQGVLETEAGKSELACSANNHFGIKCKSDYLGDKFLHDDDRPKECFKMYRCAEDSYKDHSDYLKRNQRYSQLFSLSQTDYESWAICLKKCGYATNPQYAQRLIKIIEDFKLQQYTYAALDSSFIPSQPVSLKDNRAAAADPDSTHKLKDTAVKEIVLTTFDPVTKPLPVAAFHALPPDTPRKIPPAITIKDTAMQSAKPADQTTPSFGEIGKLADSARNRVMHEEAVTALQAMPAPKTDTPKKEQTAVTTTIDTRYDSGKVITVNGLKAFYAFKGEMLLQYAVKYNIRYPHLLELNDLPDGPLPANMLVYLEKKLTSGTHAKHTVKEGEDMLQVSQAEGMQLRRLQLLNMMEIGDEPATGAMLELQNGATRKPPIRKAAETIPGNMTTQMLGKSTPPDQMITISRPKPVTKPLDSVKHVSTPAYVETIIPDKPKPAPEAVIPPKVEMKVDSPAIAVTKPIPVVDTSVLAASATDTAKDDLAALKAELDKVVYTNDSNLIATTKPIVKPVPEKEEPAKPGKSQKDPKKQVEPKASKFYIVKKGETLSGIANRNNTTVKKLMKWNDIDPLDLRPGQKLRVKE